MYIPANYSSAVLLMLGTMVCWGSWANTQKLAINWRFELFYWDYVFGVLATSILYAITLGSTGTLESYHTVLFRSDFSNMVSALLGGVIFNAANLLLVAAIAIAGMAVAFPIGIGIALVVGTMLSYWVQPSGSILWLIIGVLFILLAILCDAKAYQRIPSHQHSGGKKGIILSVISGLLMGVFYPLVARSRVGEAALDPYSASILFSLGVLLCNVPLNILIMKRPFLGLPLTYKDYCNGSLGMHFLGWLGGAIWCTGMTFNLVAAGIASPAIAYAFGQGATMVAAIWGVFVWKEFKHAIKVTPLLIWMFMSYILGLLCIGMARV